MTATSSVEPANPSTKFISAARFAAKFDPPLSLATVRRWAKQNIPGVTAIKIGGKYFFLPLNTADFLQNNSPKNGGENGLTKSLEKNNNAAGGLFNIRSEGSRLVVKRRSEPDHLKLTAGGADIFVKVAGPEITVRAGDLLPDRADKLATLGFSRDAQGWSLVVQPARVARIRTIFQRTCSALGIDCREALKRGGDL